MIIMVFTMSQRTHLAGRVLWDFFFLYDDVIIQSKFLTIK